MEPLRRRKTASLPRQENSDEKYEHPISWSYKILSTCQGLPFETLCIESCLTAVVVVTAAWRSATASSNEIPATLSVSRNAGVGWLSTWLVYRQLPESSAVTLRSQITWIFVQPAGVCTSLSDTIRQWWGSCTSAT